MRVSRSLVILAALAMAGFAVAQYRDTRPVRGCWLRPPDPISSLGNTIKGLADAGVTDLYIETLYWGVSTGKQGVFNARFAYDYLAQAIPLAASYGIRTHCWVESGYWQYQSTGGYNFTNNPDWKVINFTTGLEGGDQGGQVFANLCHPGVQQKLRNYTAELATYPGLWGIQTDYHRMPIDNNTGDNYSRPWSFDTYSAATMATLYPGCNISTNARRSGDAYYNQFVAWRKAGISEAANQMNQGINSSNPDVVFSGAVFPDPNSSAEASKCQDWGTWTANGYIEQAVPMCYAFTVYSTNPSTNTIVKQLQTANTYANGKRVIAGLYPGSGHPTLTAQLDGIKTYVGAEDFVIFDATSLAGATAQNEMKTWITANRTLQRADFTSDDLIDARDWNLFWNRYRGIPASGSGNNARYNMNGDASLDSVDQNLFREALRKFRLGDGGVLDETDRAAMTAAIGQPVPAGYKSLYDWDGDGDVDVTDQRFMELGGSAAPILFVTLGLQGVTGADPRDVTVEFRNPGSTTPVKSWTWKTDVQGRLVALTPGAGNWDASIKVGHWLRKTVPISVGTTDLALTFSLENGDVDGDNVVSIFDYIALSDAFDTSVGDAAFDPNADLDEDGVVSIFDYIQLSDNFDMSGDE